MGNWLDKDHSLPAIKNWIWGQFQALKGGTRIVANTDLNTIFDTGNYYCDSNTTAQSLANIPLAASSMHAFTMKVGYATGVGYLYQELIDYYTGVRYYRYHDSYTQGDTDTTKWKDWKAFAQNSNTIPSAHCTTAAGTAGKTANCTYYQLKANSYLHVLISNTNTAASALTLNVNGKGAKPIWINGSASSSSNYTLPAGTYIVFYDGTNYHFNTGSGVSDLLLPLGRNRQTRRTSANIPSDNSAGLSTFLATSSMTEGKPLGGDAKILHMNWDNAHRWAGQLAVTNTSMIEARTQSVNSGDDWSAWRRAAMFGTGVTPTSGKALVTDGVGGQIKTVDMAGAIEGTPTETKRRAAFVAQSSSGGLSKPWYKVAEVTVTAKSQDREITFLVEDTMASAGNKYFMQGRTGILKVRCRTNESDSFGDSTITSGGESTYLTWLSNSGYFDLDFALAVKVTAGTSVVYELWTKINFNYVGRRFIVLSEGYRNIKESEDWTLYNTWTNGSQASLPSGYEYIYSNISAQSAHRLVDEDLNNIKFANSTSYGVAYFYAAGSNTVVNSPFSSGSAFGLVLRKTAGNICVQEIWATNGDYRYFRRWDGGSSSNNWTEWTKMPTSFASPAFTGTPTAPTAAAGTNTTQLATTAFVKTACDAATDAVVGPHLIYKVGTCVHTRENVPPSTVGTWVRTYRIDRWSRDPAYYNDELYSGEPIEMVFSWYQVSNTNNEGLTGYFNIPGLGESGATVNDIGIELDFDSSGGSIVVFYNGTRYNANKSVGVATFNIRGISGDTLFFDLAGLKMTTNESGTGTVLPNNSSGTGRIKGIAFSCSKSLYHWTRVA